MLDSHFNVVLENCACTNGPERNVMCHCHANSTLNPWISSSPSSQVPTCVKLDGVSSKALFDACTQKCAIDSCRCNCTLKRNQVTWKTHNCIQKTEASDSNSRKQHIHQLSQLYHLSRILYNQWGCAPTLISSYISMLTLTRQAAMYNVVDFVASINRCVSTRIIRRKQMEMFYTSKFSMVSSRCCVYIIHVTSLY